MKRLFNSQIRSDDLVAVCQLEGAQIFRETDSAEERCGRPDGHDLGRCSKSKAGVAQIGYRNVAVFILFDNRVFARRIGISHVLAIWSEDCYQTIEFIIFERCYPSIFYMLNQI